MASTSPSRSRSAAGRRSADVERGYGSGIRGGEMSGAGAGAGAGPSGSPPMGGSAPLSPPILAASLPGIGSGSGSQPGTGMPTRPSSSFIPSTSSSALAPSPSIGSTSGLGPARPSSLSAAGLSGSGSYGGLGVSNSNLSHSTSSASDAPFFEAVRSASAYGPELSLPPNRLSSYSVSSSANGTGAGAGLARPSPLGRDGSDGSGRYSVGSDGSVCFFS